VRSHTVVISTIFFLRQHSVGSKLLPVFGNGVFFRESSQLAVVEVFESKTVDVHTGIGGRTIEDGHGRRGSSGQVHRVVLVCGWLSGGVGGGGEIGRADEADSKASKPL